MNKIIKYLAICFAVFLALSIIAGCVTAVGAVVTRFAGETGSLDGDTRLFYTDENGGIVLFGLKIGNSEAVTSFTRTFEREEIKALHLESEAVAMTVQIGDSFLVDARNIPERYTVDVKDGVLRILTNSSKGFWLFGNTAKNQSITVTVPRDFVAEYVELDSGSGIVEISGLTMGRLSMDTGSGKCHMSGISAERTNMDTGSGAIVVLDSVLGTTKVDSGSGSVELTNVDANNLLVDSGSGRVIYKGIMTGNCIFDTGSGSVSLTLDAAEEDYNITADTGSGGFYINGRNVKDTTIRHEQAENTIVFDTGSGRVSIEFSGTYQER